MNETLAIESYTSSTRPGAFTIRPRGPFALGAARAFACTFTPGAGTMIPTDAGLSLAFRLEPQFVPVQVQLREDASGVHGEFQGDADPLAVARQVARMLSLDFDGVAWRAVCERDAALAPVYSRQPGFRPLCFPSAYEAAVGAVLGQRISMEQAKKYRLALALAHGDPVEGADAAVFVMPPPSALAALTQTHAIPGDKLARLRHVARAALDGKLETERLRRLPSRDAIAELEAIPGIGAWSAQHVLLRGCGVADALPTAEPRVLRAVALALGRNEPMSLVEYRARSAAWRPFQVWATVMLMRELAGTPQWRGRDIRGRMTDPAKRSATA